MMCRSVERDGNFYYEMINNKDHLNDSWIKDISEKVGMDDYSAFTASMAEAVYTACKDRKEMDGEELAYFPLKVLNGIFMKAMLKGLKKFREDKDLLKVI
jgi:hypothetical protein